MSGFSTADHRQVPPRIDIPRAYNAAHDLVERNLAAGRAGKVAFIDDRGTWTFGDVAERVHAFGNALTALGLKPEQRVLLCLLDSIDFPTAFLGAIRAGIVPVAANTLLMPADYEYMLRDSRACALIVTAALVRPLAPLFDRIPALRHVVVAGDDDAIAAALADPAVRAAKRVALHALPELLAAGGGECPVADTTRDDTCFWLYSSGSTGAPKGTLHIQSSMIYTAELYAKPILGLTPDDVVFSAAKLFFAYGLNNGLTFPLAIGATAVLMAERPTPAAVFARLIRHQPTIFYGVPTLFGAMLANAQLPARGELRMRRCTSAGEALPAHIGRRWTDHFGVEILDGLGSTEMLHIFLSNRAGDVHYGTTGTPVPGYALRILAEDGQAVGPGQIGELQVCGPTSAAGYWNNREKTQSTFVGAWTRSGDKYSIDPDGNYVYAGRTDDMLKVSGIYVSPIEVEASLISHPAVLEAAVIGKADDGELIKPAAYVVLKGDRQPSQALADELRQHVRSQLAPYKYPRWIEFIDELPKTATGKIQRYKLRALAAQP
jgi:benzoate-CoA ligase